MPTIFGPTPAEIQNAIAEQQRSQGLQVLGQSGTSAFLGFQGGTAFGNALQRFANIVDPRVARAQKLQEIQNQVRQRTEGKGIGDQLKTTTQLLQANGFFDEALQAEQLMLEMEQSGIDLTKSQFELREARSKAVLKERELARELGMIPATDRQKLELAKLEGEIKEIEARTGLTSAKAKNEIGRQAMEQATERRKELKEEAKDRRSQITALRGHYVRDTKVLRSALDAFDTVIAASTQGPGLQGISDNALIFAYAKILDPISTVRESEFETLSRGGRSLPERLQDDIRGLTQGKPLSDPARVSIVNEVKKIMRERVNRFRETTLKSYAKDATRLGIPLEDITRGVGDIPDEALALQPLPGDPQVEQQPQGVPRRRLFRQIQGN